MTGMVLMSQAKLLSTIYLLCNLSMASRYIR